MPQRHIIKQQILDLRVGANIQAFELQNKLSTLYRSSIIPLIEAYCNQLSDPDRIHRIDRLELDLGTIDLQTLETEIVQKIAERLSVQLPAQLPSPTIRQSRSTPSSGFNPRNVDTVVSTPSNTPNAVAHSSHHPARYVSGSPTTKERTTGKGTTGNRPTSPLEADFEIIYDFLHTGRLPWWCEPLDQSTLEKRVANLLVHAPEQLKVLLQHGLRQDTIRRRLLYQFSEQTRLEILCLLAPTWHATVHAYLKDVQTLAPHVECWRGIPINRLKQTIWQGIVLQLSLSSSNLHSIQPSSKTDLNAVLRGNLLHIASQRQSDEPSSDGRSLVHHLLKAIQSLQKTGVHLTSTLPQVLTTLSPSNISQATHSGIHVESTSETGSGNVSQNNLQTPSAPELVASVNLLMRHLTELAHLADLSQTPSLRPKIQALISQLNDLNRAGRPSQSTAISDRLFTSIRVIISEFDDLIVALEAQEVPPTVQQKIQQVYSQLKIVASIASPISSSPPSQALLSQTSSPSLSRQTSSSTSARDDAIYIQNSGLLLLWPFLNRFFGSLGLVESGQFLSLEATHRAVLLLQYLVDASVESLESALPLNKLLCGLDLDEPVPAILLISEVERTECEELLQAIIQNWSALKRTSIDGLRRAFLQRTGVLRHRYDGWCLQVEQQTHDILIDQIPWSIRVVNLPWMESLLHVEW